MLTWIETVLKPNPYSAARRRELTDMDAVDVCVGEASADPEVLLAYCLDYDEMLCSALHLGQALPDP